MKMIKRTLWVIVAFFVLSGIAGYFYFDRKFTPPQNYLTVSGVAHQVPIRWVETKENPHAALLLPVKIEGASGMFYMQLDSGSPITLFYEQTLKSIPALLNGKVLLPGSGKASLTMTLGAMTVSSNSFKTIPYGEAFNVDDTGAINIIGTIGTDLLEKRVVVIDFNNNLCSFSKAVQQAGLIDFEFKKRKILLPVNVNGKQFKFLYDSGTSGYELITSQKTWAQYKTPNGIIKNETGNSWGNTLSVSTAPAQKLIELGGKSLTLTEVTSISGTTKIQNLLMKFSGMEGMLGNKLLLKQKLILDCAQQKFKIE